MCLLDERLGERMNFELGMNTESFIADWARTTQDRQWIPPTGRSSIQTAQDMLEAIEDAASDGRAILACHGGATVDLLRTLLGDEELERRAPGIIPTGIPGGAVTRLVRSASGWQVIEIAATSHLPEDLRSGLATV